MNFFRRPTSARVPNSRGRLALALLFTSCTCVAAGDDVAKAPTPSPAIRWDLARINGLEVGSESLGIRDRIRVVTLGTSGCTPRSATLLTINPESGAKAAVKMPIQGRSIEFEIEDTARAGAHLRIECLERGADDGPPRTFTLALDPGKSR